MKIAIILITSLLIIGCSSKVNIHKNNSIEIQKQNASKAWHELDKE